MKINLPSHLKLAVGEFFLLFLITCANGGPPLQGEIPIGFYSPEDELLQKASDLELPPVNGYKQEESYRLPLSVQPIHYDLEIRPILDSAGDDQFTAPGKVAIRVKCFEATDSITLHSKGIAINHTDVTVVGVAPTPDVVVTGHEEDGPRSFYIINLDRNLTVDGEYLVTIPFTAPVSEDRLAGLYKSTYQAEDGSTRVLATTQFQKADASRAFPCFDEPSQAFRATFNVKIGRKEQVYHSLANTERVGEPEPIIGLDGWVWDNHAPTVNMPPYLIAIIVSDFKNETAPADLYPKPVRTWAPPPLVTDTSAKFSAQAAARIISFFEDYFDYPYQLNKMDSVAIPDFAAGAMENWGLNTYRINLMVWLEEENTLLERWRSAAVIAHELAHQWFGNLVTCEWWNDTWLNEGFARYLQFIAANHTGEDFRSLDRYVIDTTQLAMDNDVLSTTEPVHSNITHRIVNQNSRIVYEKAAALIRMMQAFLTEETLIKALRIYLKRHEYGGVVQDDLFTALTEQAAADRTFTNYTVKEVMDTWTLQTGFPIVRVSKISSTMLYISQEKFTLNPADREANDDTWYVPISYVTASNPDFSARNLGPKDWIEKDTILQSLIVDSTDQWVIVNPDARGYYRVIYDDSLTGLLIEQLKTDHIVISVGSRSQLIDDYFKSATAKYVNIRNAMELTNYLNKEDDFIVWTTVVNNLTPLFTRLADTPAFANFKTHILKLIVEPLERIGPNQNPDDSVEVAVLRTQLLDWACSMEHELCSKTANDLITAWRAADPNDKIPVPTDIQPMIYCGAVAASTGNTEVQDFLLQEYVRNRGTRQQTLIVNALACDQVNQNLQRLMERAIDEDTGNELKINEHGLALLGRIALNSAGRQLLMTFLNNEHAEITRVHGIMAVPDIISRLVPYLSSQSASTLPQEVESFIEEYLKDENLPTEVRNSLEASRARIDENSAWMNYYYEDVSDWLAPAP